MGSHNRVGSGPGAGFNIHFPFNFCKNQIDPIGDKDYIFACEEIFFPVIRAFQPDLIIISAGFDSALGDPLG
jgi:histone deacetylase 6